MKKKLIRDALLSGIQTKMWKIMRLNAVFLFVCVTHAWAISGYSQETRLTLKMSDSKLIEVLDKIEEESEFFFLFNQKLVDVERKVDIDAKKQTIDTILQKLFAGTNVNHMVIDRQIVLTTFNEEAFAEQQQPAVSGTVTDESGQPLPGVTVVVKGTTQGTVTNADGEYSISSLPEDATLVFSFVGMETIEREIDSLVINVTMIQSIESLGEVVVTALGIKRDKKALGYAVTDLQGENIAENKTVDFASSLQGKVAGLDISSVSGGPAASSRIVLRGISDLSGNNQPLIVVDGVPVDNSTLGSAGTGQYASGVDLGDGISSINPDDIASLSVLKGPAAAALYGSRATNGVLMITTKQGQKNERIGIEVSSQTTFDFLNMGLDDRQMTYGQGRNGVPPLTYEQARTTTQVSWGGKLNPNLSIIGFVGEEHPYGLADSESNIADFFRVGISSQNMISLNGGNEKGTFRLSYGRTDVIDIVPESGLARNSFNLRGSWQFTDKFNVDAKITYFTSEVNNRPALADDPSNIGNSLLWLAPNVDESQLKENYQDEKGNYVDWNGNEYRINPYWVINKMRNESTKDRITGFIHLNYKITDWLNIDYLPGTDYYNFVYMNYASIGTPRLQSGALTQTRVITQETNHQLLLNFDKDINEDFRISGNIGGNIRVYNSTNEIISASNATTGAIVSINDFQNRVPIASHPRKQVNSLYGVGRIAYKEWLFLDASLRNDWSSTLPEKNRSYMYPSVSGSFIISELLNASSFPYLKIRGSWAQVGGDTNPYALENTYSNYPVSINGKTMMRISSNEVPNINLQPTSTDAIEFGINMSAFDNRLGLDATYYNQATTDQIMSLPLSPVTGYTFAKINAGEIVNKGIELNLNGTPIKTSNFSWNLIAVWAKNVNKINSLHPDVKNLTLSTARWAGAEIRAVENERYGAIVGKKQLRYEGQKVFNDQGLPVFGSELEILGYGTHDWLGSLTSTFKYKNLIIRFLFDAKWGADLFSMTNQSAFINGSSVGSLEGREEWYRSEEERKASGITEPEWEATGGYLGEGVVLTYIDENGQKQVATNIREGVDYNAEPNSTYVDPQVYWSNFQDGSPEPFIYDASYVKIRELSFSYNVPTRLFNNKIDMNVSVIGRNLLTLYSNIPGIDPESTYNNGNGQGFEYGSLPSRRTLGINLKFKF